MSRLFFSYETDACGATLRLLQKPLIGSAKAVPVEDWAERMTDRAFAGVSHLLAILDNADSPVERRGDGVFIDYLTIASLTEPQALGLGFPPSVRYALQIETKNLITDPDFRILCRWIGLGNRVLHADREGAFLSLEGAVYRVPEPLFSVIEAAEAFAAPETADDEIRMAHLAQLQSLLPKSAQDQLSIDRYFSSFRVLHASAFRST
jgi:hypothetical protein